MTSGCQSTINCLALAYVKMLSENNPHDNWIQRHSGKTLFYIAMLEWPSILLSTVDNMIKNPAKFMATTLAH